MNLRMLKKDLVRKKSINIILLIFMILATTFIAGSINNVIVITNAMDNYIEISEVRDVTLITSKPDYGTVTDNDRIVEEFLKNNENVIDYKVDFYQIMGTDSINSKNDESIEFINGNTMFVTCLEGMQEKIFDSNNNEITEVLQGDIYLSRQNFIGNGLEIGDILYLKDNNGYYKELRVAGYFKDCLYGSDFMGNKRIVISEEDFEDYVNNVTAYCLTHYAVNCKDVNEFTSEVSNADFNIMSMITVDDIKMSYIMDIITALIFLVISICLIVISIIMIRTTIVFTINEDYKEIGILKAVGINAGAIRKLYLTKYVCIAAVGMSIGFILSIFFSKLMLYQATQNIVITDNGTNILIQLLCSVMSFIIVSLFAYLATGKINKLKPMDAIRSGNNGERFKRKGILRLSVFKTKPTTFMAVNDVLSELGKYIVVFFTVIIGIWLITMPANTINTLKSDNIGWWFGMPEGDYVIQPVNEDNNMLLSADREYYIKQIEAMEQKLRDNGIETEYISVEMGFQFKISHEGNVTRSISYQGIGSNSNDYVYEEGSGPIYDNEIAITHVIADRIKAQPGDTVWITINGEEKDFIVTGIFQTLNNLGQGIRFNSQIELPYEEKLAIMGYVVKLKDDNGKSVNTAMEISKDIFPSCKTQTIGNFILSMMGDFISQIDGVKYFVLVMMTAIIVMVAALLQKMFLIREQGEVSLLKAMGFSDKSIIAWQTKRIVIVVFCGVVAGSLTGRIFSQLTSGFIFKMMGASNIEFEIKPLEIYIIYPLVLLVSTIIVCVITASKVRKVSVQEINSIE